MAGGSHIAQHRCRPSPPAQKVLWAVMVCHPRGQSLGCLFSHRGPGWGCSEGVESGTSGCPGSLWLQAARAGEGAGGGSSWWEGVESAGDTGRALTVSATFSSAPCTYLSTPPKLLWVEAFSQLLPNRTGDLKSSAWRRNHSALDSILRKTQPRPGKHV